MWINFGAITESYDLNKLVGIQLKGTRIVLLFNGETETLELESEQRAADVYSRILKLTDSKDVRYD